MAYGNNVNAQTFLEFLLLVNPSWEFLELVQGAISLSDDHVCFAHIPDTHPQFQMLAEAIPGTTPWLKLLFDATWDLPPAVILHTLMGKGDVPPHIWSNFKALASNYGAVYPMSWESDSFLSDVCTHLVQSGIPVLRSDALINSQVHVDGRDVPLRDYLHREWKSRMAALESLFQRFPR